MESHESSQKIRKITPRQARAAHLLASGMTVREVAGQLKIRPETLSRWKRLPAFEAEHSRAVEAVQSALRERMSGLVDKAINVLGDFHAFGSDWKGRTNLALDIIKLLGAPRVWTGGNNIIE